MFRAIYENFVAENTTQNLPPAAADYIAYQNIQQDAFNRLSNPIIVRDERVLQAVQDDRGLFNTTDTDTRGAFSRDIDLANRITTTDIPQYLKDKQAICQKSQLSELVDTYNPLEKVRCGWIYEKPGRGKPPRVSAGALGSRTGPIQFFQNPPGKWYWDLDEALKVSERDYCMDMRRCEDVNDPKYVGKCAFDKKRGYGVPITTKGAVKYSDDPFVGGSGANLIQNSGQCPQPPAPGSPQDIVRRSIDVCTPRPDGTYSRDCMLQQIQAAGCKTDGALYNALINQATPNNYGAGLERNSAFQQYQNRAKAPLLSGIIKDGRVATDVALTNLKELNVRSSQADRSAIHYAARDLCLQKGYFDNFDFCWDLTPASQPPFRLDCLQREFLKNGGQQTGEAYPTVNNKAQMWDKLGSWQEVQNTMLKMKQQATSSEISYGDQRSVMEKLLGIVREKPKDMIERLNGAEIFWFDRDRGGIFMGRRISQTGLVTPFFSTGGDVENTGKREMVEFCMVTNFRPNTTQDVRLTIETDDSARIYLNRDNIDNGNVSSERGQDGLDFMDRFYPQAPTRHVQRNCWKLEAQKPNYITAWWQEDYGYAHWLMYMSQCQPNAPLSHISPNLYTLTQEPDAPMLSFNVKVNSQGRAMNFREYRLPGGFPALLGPGISYVPAPASGPLAKYRFGAKFGKSDSIRINKQIFMNAFRTLNMSFVINELPGFGMEAILFTLGNLRIGIQNRNGRCFVRTMLSSGGVQIETINTADRTPLEVGKAYMYTLKMESPETDMLPTKLYVQVAYIEKASNMNFPDQATAFTFTNPNNNPLYSRGDSGVIILGDPNGSQSALVTLFTCDLYDYEMINSQYQRAALNDWVRAWIVT
jgi:hypothetical protein